MATITPDPAPEYVERIENLLRSAYIAYTLVHSVNRNGDRRKISVFIVSNGEILDITYVVSAVLGYRLDDQTRQMIVHGGGMDMAFHVVDRLAQRYGKLSHRTL